VLKTDRYVIPPIINNSFDSTIKGLIRYFISEYLISENEEYSISYDSECVIDNTTIGSIIGPNSNMKRPDKIYVTVNFMNNGSWTNSGGGIVFCTVIFWRRKGIEKIDIRWDTFGSGDYYFNEIDIKKIRKLKLGKINKIAKK
jgi:hypothetical protein